jgi:hypothetical protein
MFDFGAEMKKYKFKAEIQGADSGAYILFPHDVEKEFGTRGRVAVKATFDGAAYTGSLVKYGHPQHMLGVLKAVRRQIGKGVGDAVEVVLWKDDEERMIETPKDLKALLKSEGLLAGFEKLSYTHRKEYIRWIEEAKKEETRQRRLAKCVEMLKAGIKTPG